MPQGGIMPSKELTQILDNIILKIGDGTQLTMQEIEVAITHELLDEETEDESE